MESIGERFIPKPGDGGGNFQLNEDFGEDEWRRAGDCCADGGWVDSFE